MGFAQPIKQVFETIYQPAVKLEREFLEQSKYFIKHQRFESHIHPMFETYLYEPVVRRLLALADRLRDSSRSLHVYLSYIFRPWSCCCCGPDREPSRNGEGRRADPFDHRTLSDKRHAGTSSRCGAHANLALLLALSPFVVGLIRR